MTKKTYIVNQNNNHSAKNLRATLRVGQEKKS